MTAQILDRTLTCFRIGDPEGGIRSSTRQARPWRRAGGTRPGSPVIYTSEHYSTALLEKLVHGSGRLPPNQHYVEITIPRGLSYEVFSPPALPGWDTCRRRSARRSARVVPGKAKRRSAGAKRVARLDRNVLINPAHPEFAALRPACTSRSTGIGGCSGG